MCLEAVFEKAVMTRSLDPTDWAIIKKSGKLLDSAKFRVEDVYRGEKQVIRYRYTDDDGNVCVGWLGFNEGGTLISVDERTQGLLQKDVRYLLMENRWHVANAQDAAWRSLDN